VLVHSLLGLNQKSIMLFQQIKQVHQRMFIKDWLGLKNTQLNLKIKLGTIKLKEIIKLEENKEEVNGQKNTKIVSIVQNLKGSLRSNIVNMVVTNKMRCFFIK
jgi:hypothetical protein